MFVILYIYCKIFDRKWALIYKTHISKPEKKFSWTPITNNKHLFLWNENLYFYHIRNLRLNSKFWLPLDETELRAFLLLPLLSLSLFFSPSKKKHGIRRERAVMATKNAWSSVSSNNNIFYFLILFFIN